MSSGGFRILSLVRPFMGVLPEVQSSGTTATKRARQHARRTHAMQQHASTFSVLTTRRNQTRVHITDFRTDRCI